MADPTTTAAAAAATTTVLRPPTPISPRPLTPTSPAAAPTDGSPTQRVLGAFFPDSDDTLSSVHECPVCLRPFSLVRFKHRCKACDRNVCNDCSKSRLRLDDMGLDGPHMPKRGQLRKDRGHKSSRVCDPCARSYFESKLDADYPSTTPPRVVEDTARAPVALANGGSSPSLSQHPTSSHVPPSYTTLVARSSSSCKWLRRRHFVFFGVFSFGLVLRLVFRLLHLMNVPGTFLCVDAIHRLTRLDVFAVGLLVLIAVDEWLAFQHTRSLKTNQRNGRPFVSESDTPLASKGADESAAARILRDKSNDHTQNASNEDDEIHDDVRLDKLGLVLTTSFNQGSDLTVASYVRCNVETAKLLVCFGKATAFAASTVAGYVASIEAAMASSLSPDGDNTVTINSPPSLRHMVTNEVDLGVATCGGKKNPSLSRCVLRLLWFLEFVETMLGVLMDPTYGDDIGSGISKAYESTLGTRHPWLIRKGVMTALSSCPLKSAVLATMTQSSPSEDIMAALADIQRHLHGILATTRSILAEHDLLDIK